MEYSCWGTREKLIAVSRSSTLSEACSEWTHTGFCQNYETPIVRCDLCNRERLRFLFRLEHQHSNRRLWVGAGCILALQLHVMEGGAIVPAHQLRQHLTNKMRSLITQEALSKLAVHAVESRQQSLAAAIIQLQQTGHVSPAYASVIFSGAETLQLSLKDITLSICCRRDEDMEELKAMPTWLVWRFWHCLTAEQQKLAALLGHTKPHTRHAELVSFQRHADKRDRKRLDCLGMVD